MKMLIAALTAPFILAPLPALSRDEPPKPIAQVHYQLNDRLVYLPVRVNRSRTLWFSLDTGARHTVIDTAVAKELKLQIVSTDQVAGAGRGTVRRQHAAAADVSVNSVNLRIDDPWVIDLNHPQVGKREDGLIGADFFAAYVVRIDPQAQIIAFFPAKEFRYRGTGAAIPLAFPDNRMFIDLGLSLSNGYSAVHHVRVDTGSNDAVSDDLVRQSPRRLKSVQGVGLGQSYVDYSGMLDRIQIGPYLIRHSWGASNSTPAIGMEILRRFTMTFDVTRGVLYLEPNAHIGDPVPAPAGISSP